MFQFLRALILITSFIYFLLNFVGTHLASTERQFGDDALIIASHCLIYLYKETGILIQTDLGLCIN